MSATTARREQTQAAQQETESDDNSDDAAKFGEAMGKVIGSALAHRRNSGSGGAPAVSRGNCRSNNAEGC